MEHYPRKIIMSLSIGSLMFTYAVYLSQLFRIGDAYMIWLVVSVLMSGILLLSAINPKKWLTQRIVLNSLLIVQAFIIGYGTLLAVYMYRPYSSILSIFGLLLILLLLVTIYHTSLKDRSSVEGKVLHVLNITVGILIAAGTFSLLYIFMLLSEDGRGEIWKVFVPLTLYIILYVIQMLLLRASRSAVAYVIATVQVILPIVVGWLWWIGVWMI